jgi:hypothetical protein
VLLSEIKAVTKDGHDITTYFETAQGSKYLLSAKGESKRIKSHHANTGGEDVGVKAWMQHCVFVPNTHETAANCYTFLASKFKHITIYMDGSSNISFKVYDTAWRDATNNDAFPKAVKSGILKDIKIEFPFVKVPKIGFNVVEFNIGANKMVSSYHLGSPVSKVKSIDALTRDELEAFKDK